MPEALSSDSSPTPVRWKSWIAYRGAGAHPGWDVGSSDCPCAVSAGSGDSSPTEPFLQVLRRASAPGLGILVDP